MTSLPLNDEIQELARRVVWFEPPERAVAIVPRFIAYAMTYGSHTDINLLRRYLTDDELCEALSQAPPGIFDPRSWAYWNLKLGRTPTPPMPERQFPHSAETA